MQAKHQIQEAYYNSKGLIGDMGGYISLASLRSILEPEVGHPLHANSRFIETAATYLRGVGLRLDEANKRVLGIRVSHDPGHRLELISKGYYKPNVGELKIPGLAKPTRYAKPLPGKELLFSRFIETVKSSKSHFLEVTAHGVCLLDDLISRYYQFYQSKHVLWIEEHARWQKEKAGDEPLPPVQDEIDEEFLQRFSISCSDYVDVKGKATKVVSGFRVRPVTCFISHCDEAGRMKYPDSVSCCIL